MTGGIYSRRQVLAGGVAGATALGLAKVGHVRANGAETVRRATQVKAAGSDLGAVKHVVFLMQENRSFDHYFGTMGGVRGFDDATNRSAFTQSWPGGQNPTLLPFHLDTKKQQAECTYDLSHSWAAEHASWNNGAMDSFVSTHTSSQYEGSLGTTTMGYYKKPDLPFYYDLAEKFTICDNYFCSVLGPTHPNRLMALSGTVDPTGAAGGPVLITNSSPDAVGSVHWDTMPEVLEDAGVSWKVYTPSGTLYSPQTQQKFGILSDAILPYFSQYQNPSSPLYQKAFLPLYPDDFVSDIKAGTLPSVSWLIPPIGYDEHPSSPPALGEWYTSQVLSALVSNPAVWSKTVLFHMYDENDGFFDHVPPPVAPHGTPGEYVTVSPLPSDADGFAGPVGMGFRVPMLVLSPFSRGGHVASQVFDHTSQLRFLEERFGVKAPNISAWRRKTAGDLTSTLHMRTHVSSVPPLPSTADDQRANVIALGCTESQILEVDNAMPSYPVPVHQSMPRQERV
jgi:phospholipase C